MAFDELHGLGSVAPSIAAPLRVAAMSAVLNYAADHPNVKPIVKAVHHGAVAVILIFGFSHFGFLRLE
jgi:hypothetical protein